MNLLNINIPEGKSGKFQIKNQAFPPGHEFNLSSDRNKILGGQNRGAIVLDKPYIISSLSETGQGVWMTNLPVEQAQHKEALIGFHGNVLVGGLGLGLAVTILSANKRVRSVTVVEKSRDVIDLVWEHLNINRFKCEIVPLDLFEYLTDDNRVFLDFDFGFYDIWQSDSETTFFDTVVPLRKLSRNIVKDIRCWNENVMRGQLAFSLSGRVQAFIQGTVDEKLFFNKDDKWMKWTVPFFEWLDGDAPAGMDEEDMLARIKDYAANYGSEQWEKEWGEL